MKKTLKFKFDLDCKVSVYVPSTFELKKEVDNSDMVLHTISELSKLFGGATASNAIGGWVSEANETIVEKVTIVYAFCSSEKLNIFSEELLALCNFIKRTMKQESVMLEINGQAKFI